MNGVRARGRLPASLLLAAAMAMLIACGQEPTVEQRIIANIRTMEAHVEAGERRPFMDYIADDFRGQDGGLNRDQVRALLVMQLNRYQRLQAQLMPIRVQETGPDTASAVFRALVTGGPNWLPESGQLFEFDTRWRLEDGEWLLVSADWEPVL